MSTISSIGKRRLAAKGKFNRLVVILSLVLLSTAVVLTLPSASAGDSILEIAQSQSPTCGYPTCTFEFNQTKGNCTNCGLYGVTNDFYGDSAVGISSNNGAPLLEQWFFKVVTYSPSSVTDLHIYLNYWVNAYISSSACLDCVATQLVILYGVAFGAISTSEEWGIQVNNGPAPAVDCGTFNGGNGVAGAHQLCILDRFPENGAAVNGNFVHDFEIISGCSPSSSCSFRPGNVYTFVFMIYTNSYRNGDFISHNSGGSPDSGPAYVYPGFYGSNNDFTNHNLCIVLSYQTSPVSSCPAPTSPPGGGGGGGGGHCCPNQAKPSDPSASFLGQQQVAQIRSPSAKD